LRRRPKEVRMGWTPLYWTPKRKLQLTPLFVAIVVLNTEIKTLLQLTHI
jgi:hypothetical protein